MADVLSPEQRKRCMSNIRGIDTKPEMIVRRLVHSLGYRYRLHDRRLPGKPDLVFKSKRKVIFVHGCYWHMHDCPLGTVAPKTRVEFWRNKRLGNVERDKRNIQKLSETGWSALIVWECQLRNAEVLKRRLLDFLG